MSVFGLSKLLYPVSAIVALCLWKSLRQKRALPLPPGPRPLPFIGNSSDFFKTNDWYHWAKHKDLYGPISSVSIFGQKLIIVNDRAVALDLLEKRSGIYSDRPTMVFAKMCGMEHLISMSPYGDFLKSQRKVLHQAMGSKAAVSTFWPILESEMHRFVSRIVANPENLPKLVRITTGAIILKVLFGYSVETILPDPLVELADTTTACVVRAFQPAAWIVDTIPFLRFLPSWAPGASFVQTAREWRKCMRLLTETPLSFVKQQMAANTAYPSLVSNTLHDDPDHQEEFILKWVAASSYVAGSDTTDATIVAFFLAMVLYPEVQKKAQAEIDNTIGTNRLPTFSDRDNLPYVNAIVKELHRWHTVVPLAIPHSVMKDDVYNGFLIPKGSIIVPNPWLYNHDPANHKDPSDFIPERFLGIDGRAPEPDPFDTSFGFGRRICPGRLLADASVYIAVATTLATLHIGKARDEVGQEITPVYDATTDELSHLKPFKCSIKLRSPKAGELIASALRDLPPVKSDAHALSTTSANRNN